MIWQERILAFAQIFFESMPLGSSTHVLLIKNALEKNTGTPIKIAAQTFFLWHIPSILIFSIFAFGVFHTQKATVQKIVQVLFLLTCTCLPLYLLYSLKLGKFAHSQKLLIPLGLVASGALLLMPKLMACTERQWKSLTIKDTFWASLFQLFALLPGVSRMACTCAGFFF